jgi:AGCS family alanine or glycine:cation symporter
MLALLIGAGLVLTVATGAVQFRRFGFAIREVLGKLFAKSAGEGTVTPFQALSTSLASTVGVGNIAGVSTAISLGGPGALFWMFFSGLVGMATKFSEIAVALHYRQPDSEGTMRGGAMYVLSKGMKMPWLGTIFALLTACAAFGIGNMVQANSVADVAQSSFGVPAIVTGGILTVLTALVVLGGLRRIVEVSQILVPLMCILYLLGCLTILLSHVDRIAGAVRLVLNSAFQGQAAIGGFAGAGVAAAVRFGIARGMFSNEAGLGSAPMIHASAVTDHPVRQACYGIFGVFTDTLVICMLTGLVILTTGVWESGETGAALAAQAFATGLPGDWGHYVVSIGVILFAFSTVIGWAYYGETGATYLFGTGALLPYRLLWIAFVFVGATGSLQLVWSVSDTLNGLMALPNLVAVLGSLALLRKLVREFFAENRG